MASRFRLLIAAAVFGLLIALPQARPEAAPTAQGQEDEEDHPTAAPLTVGSMAIASDSALAIEGMAVDIAADRVTYTYRLHNKGTAKLALAASIAMPDLEVNTEGATVYALPAQVAEKPRRSQGEIR